MRRKVKRFPLYFFEYVTHYSFMRIIDFIEEPLFSSLDGFHKVKSNDAIFNEGPRLQYFQAAHHNKGGYTISWLIF